MSLVLLVAASGLLSFAGTALVLHYAKAHSVMDLPNERSSHTIPTPRGGGLAIAVTYLGFLVFLWLRESIDLPTAAALFGGGFVVGAIGLLDDHRHVNAAYRLIVHAVAVIWLIVLLGGSLPINFFGVSVDLGVAGHVVALVGLVWLLNVYNFMDGIDGIASVEAITIALSAAVLLWWFHQETSVLLLFLVLLAAVAGFLVLNWPPARIFMGDCGSGFLGFTLGGLAWITVIREVLPIWTWLILFGAFLVDATVTLWRRWRRGEPIHKAHRSHAYQRLSRRLASHSKVTTGVLAINIIWLAPLAFLSVARPDYGVLLTLIAWLPLVVLCWKAGAGLADDAC